MTNQTQTQTQTWRIREIFANGTSAWVKDGWDIEAWELEYASKSEADADVAALSKQNILDGRRTSYQAVRVA